MLMEKALMVVMFGSIEQGFNLDDKTKLRQFLLSYLSVTPYVLDIFQQ